MPLPDFQAVHAALDRMGRTALEIKRQRDELLAALQEVLAWRDKSMTGPEADALLHRARAAIAAATGEV